MDEFLVKQYHEFHKFFFNQVTDRLKAIDPSKKYKLPSVNFIDIPKHKQTSAYFLPDIHAVILDKEAHSEFNLESLPHEILHSIRDQSSDDPRTTTGYNHSKSLTSFMQLLAERNKEETIDTKIVELFGQLDKIVMRDVLKDSPYEAPEKTDDIYTQLNTLQEVHNSDFTNIELEIEKTVKLYEEFIKDFQREIKLEKDDLTAIEPAYHELHEQILNNYKAATYCIIVAEMSSYAVADLAEGMSSLLNSIDSLNSITEEAKTGKGLATAKKFFEKGLYSTTPSNIDSTAIYFTVDIAINEAETELEENWPEVFLMHRDEVKTKYLTPVTDEIDRMKIEYEKRTQP